MKLSPKNHGLRAECATRTQRDEASGLGVEVVRPEKLGGCWVEIENVLKGFI